VNRVFRDKPGGLVVELPRACPRAEAGARRLYRSGGHGDTAIDQEQAVVAMLTRYEVCRDYFFRFDWSKWTTGTPAQKLSLLPAGQEHILAAAARDPKPADYRQKFLQAVTELSKAFALAVPHDKALAIRDDVGFFQAVRARHEQRRSERKKTGEERDAAIRQIISRAVASDEVGRHLCSRRTQESPTSRSYSDQFLAEVRGMPQKNLAVELLRKLLAAKSRPVAEVSHPVEVICRDAGAGDPQIPEPRH